MKLHYNGRFGKILGLMLILVTLQLSTFSRTDSIPKGFQIIIHAPQRGWGSPSYVLITSEIQNAIDSCAAVGGGTVRFREGLHLTGSLQLKSNVTLQLDKGAILQGSDKYSDYKNDTFIFGKELSDVSIQGEGIIDGGDCYNPKGEEGLRGPHCIQLINCKNISVKGITIRNSANYAIFCMHCSNAIVEKVSIRGGHDGLHTRFCNNFTLTGCDFRTGDDAIAGWDNRDFIVTDCSINTSCNGFRMGCYNFTVKQCKIWGPGEYIHRIGKRNNMLSAFTHCSIKEENTKIPSDNWLIQDLTVDHVDNFYNYDYDNGTWQTGQPVRSIHFKNIKATGLLKTFSITGDRERQLKLTIKNSDFSYREGTSAKSESVDGVKSTSNAFFYAANFALIELHNVTLQKRDTVPLLNCNSGDMLIIDRVKYHQPSHSKPFIFENIPEIKK